MKSDDIIICAMPPLSVDRLPGAPALLKSAVELAGYTASSIDLSLAFFTDQCRGNIDTYNRWGSVFRPSETASAESQQAADEWVAQSIAKIKQNGAQIIGLSVFTYFQHRSTVMLARAIRKQLPTIKIILGGHGVPIQCQSLSNEPNIRQIDLLKPFSQYMIKHNLCDYIVSGSGLDELINIMQKEISRSTISVDLKEADSVIYKSPIPNYTDYDLSSYVWNTGIALPVTGSKGCVRSCTFCDIPGRFGRFKYRTGEDIANEMIYLNKKYGVNIFEFTDSLVNGSIKAFKEWLTLIAEYNDTCTKENKIHWVGQYICRPQSQTPADIYPLMARAGVQNLVIGIESGSNEVLAAMNKKMTVQDAYNEFQEFEKHGIQTHVLMFSGFYNETWSRYLENLNFIINIHGYIANHTISKLSIGPPLFINNKMYLSRQADELGIILNEMDDMDWRMTDDPENDFVERCRRRLISQLVTDRLNIPLSGQSISVLHQIKERLCNLYNLSSKSFPLRTEWDQRKLDYLIPTEIQEKINDTTVDIFIEFKTTAAQGRWPHVKLLINDIEFINRGLEEIDSISAYSRLPLDCTTTKIQLEYYGKTEHDTQFDLNGQIQEDQSIQITKFIVNGIDLVSTILYKELGKYTMLLDPQKIAYYQDHGYSIEPGDSLQMFENGHWKFDINLPVLSHLVQLSGHQEKHEKWPDPKLLFEIHDIINTIRPQENQ